MLESRSLSLLKSVKPLDSTLIDCFSEILMTKPFSAFKLSSEKFIADRYLLGIEAFKQRARSVLNKTIILDSDFVATLMISKPQRFSNADLWIIKMVNKYSRATIRQIIIPLCVCGIWILISIELYSLQIRIYNPVKYFKLDIAKYLNPIKEYIAKSEWFQHNSSIVESKFKPNGSISSLEIKEIPCAYQIEKSDSGVMVCLFMYSLCQGIKPLNINLFSKRRRYVLYKAFRDSNIDKVVTLFNKDS